MTAQSIKIFKRLVIDLPKDIASWVSFYRMKRPPSSTLVAELWESGIAEMPGFISADDVAILQELFDEYEVEKALRIKGQGKGRIFKADGVKAVSGVWGIMIRGAE